ncbi:hypothetical protein [Pseudonocardia sp. DLS-67]
MRTSNPDRLTAATAEQLLDGGPGPAGLTRLLAAAAGPGTASELAGETAAKAAFVDAPRAIPLSSAQVRRRSMLSTALSKILAAKALAAVVLLAGAGGGVALAANASQSSSPTGETSTTSTETDGSAPAGDDAVDPDANAAGPSPEPSIAGLCKAWAAGATDNPGKAAENPAFRSLIEAAGSEEDVPDFCADRERTDPGRSDTAPGHADDEPDADPTDGPGRSEGRGTPPTAAPGNPDHPAGPKADRANRGGADTDPKSTDSKSTGSNSRDNRDGDREDDSESGRTRSERGGQGRGGGESADHRQND